LGTRLKPPSLPEQLVRGYVASYVDRAAHGVMFLVLFPIVLVIAIVIFAVLGFLIIGTYVLIGEPGPPLGTAFSLGYFIASFVVLFLVLRRGHRWLTLAMNIADAPAAMIDPPYEVDKVIGEAPDPAAFRARLAAADARHGTPSDTPSDTPDEP